MQLFPRFRQTPNYLAAMRRFDSKFFANANAIQSLTVIPINYAANHSEAAVLGFKAQSGIQRLDLSRKLGCLFCDFWRERNRPF